MGWVVQTSQKTRRVIAKAFATVQPRPARDAVRGVETLKKSKWKRQFGANLPSPTIGAPG